MTLCIRYRHVLGAESSAAVFEAALAQAEHFEHSRIAPRRIDTDRRMSHVLYEDRLSEVSPLIRAVVEAHIDEAIETLGIGDFERAGLEIQLTSHNDAEFFERHTDSCTQATATRMVAFVYYFHRVPKAYSGGELVFFDGDRASQVIEPENDSLVLFDPQTPHEVRPVQCPSGRLEDGRFTLNGWVHRRPMPSRSPFAFDERIFTPLASWTGPHGPPMVSADRRAANPSPPAAGAEDEDARFRDLLLLYGDLHRQSGRPDEIDVRPGLRGECFFDEYYSRNRPVVVPGMVSSSEAVRTWTPEYFASAFGSVSIEVTSGRESHPDYEVKYRETVRSTTMAQFVELIESVGESNDVYLVARNDFFAREPMRSLRDQLGPLGDIIDESDRRPGVVKMWFGPSGTVTPLHYDEHSILFVQVYGRKRFKLIPSFDAPRLYVTDRYYSEVDLEHVDLRRYPAFASATVIDVELAPGDALFLPVAWWHWARSTSISISVTFSSFAVPGNNTIFGRH